jgi:hypothetical protein
MSRGLSDAYVICRFVRDYYRKNDYVPTVEELKVPQAYVELLVKNGVVELRSHYEGGHKVLVVLTEKGARMAEERR